jgi:EpsI family protein
VGIRALIVVLIVGASGAYARQLVGERVFASARPELARLPTAVAGWYSEDIPLTPNVAAVLDADATLLRVYRDPAGKEVGLFVAYFAQQQVNSQIHSPRLCMPGAGWKIVSTEEQMLQISDDPVPVTRMLIQRNEREREILYRFRTRSGNVTGEYALKWDLLRNALARRPTDAVFVRYDTPIEDAAAARELMRQLDSQIAAILGEVGLR